MGEALECLTLINRMTTRAGERGIRTDTAGFRRSRRLRGAAIGTLRPGRRQVIPIGLPRCLG
jgi:hypothetical protein